MTCYGGWAPDLRSRIEIRGHDEYLNGVVDFVVKNNKNIVSFFISGGMFDSKGRTECETVRPELIRRLAVKGIQINIETDKKSITGQEIMEKFLSTWQSEYSDADPVLFVDQVRAEVNRYSFHYYCKKLGIDNLNEDVIHPLHRLDDHPDSTLEKQAKKLKMMKEKGVDFVEKEERKIRLELAKNSEINTICRRKDSKQGHKQ